ncbi:MAG: 30S ribosomal protein S9 [uncultured bacterium]|nr:MAG: 30S ribosomal protein S9 [uncultured bacterium]
MVKPSSKNKYWYGTGRRKNAIARVKLLPGSGNVKVNEKEFKVYFSSVILRNLAIEPLVHLGKEKDFDISAKLNGGGIKAQAEALRHGIARALLLLDATWKKGLKKQGYLKRDSRMKERKKYGLKRARRAPQWQKR